MQSMTQIYRLTVYADGSLEDRLVERFLALGAKGYTATDARGVGQKAILANVFGRSTVSRIEVLVQQATAQKIVDYLNKEVIHKFPVTLTVDEVKVIRADHF